VETMELKTIADLLKHCLAITVKMDSVVVPGITLCNKIQNNN
jgi:hypothetical protein